MKNRSGMVWFSLVGIGVSVALLAFWFKAKTNTPLPVTEPVTGEKHEIFTESIPGASVSFTMIRIPGGAFRMGSPEHESLRNQDEGPIHEVTLSPFWIGENEVSWNEYEAFLRATSSPRRTAGQKAAHQQYDAVSRATPPWGAPDQGWGRGARPAITMSWYAATVYCAWLSKVTGKKYRLPTEAEWEYSCRGGTTTPYFFRGDATDYTTEGLLNKMFKPDISTIGSYVAYRANSSAQTRLPADVRPNQYGLRNMLGNVAEFCSDYYSSSAYQTGGSEINPAAPISGQEHVIRGGSFRSDAKGVRCASRDHTRTNAWLASDPQMPKSLWWYSDSNDVGFRVVCESDRSIAQ